MGGGKYSGAKGGEHRSSVAKSPKEVHSIGSITREFFASYKANTPKKLQILDIYLAYILFTGVVQFVYCCLVGTFPFNAFLSGFISCVASFVLGVCLRMHSNPQNKHVFVPFCPEAAYGDFIFAHVILHLVVFNFIG
ncbi:unnamed protein product [Calicophoron daubneyi]|uniref:Dolichyl-diphosphooligosaccharide--protein glycosyltransferase subunit DAD1 n=1 Tax=Calicophoron daubneyi TaxID=300641 RepID=A0AAV2TRX3_CALDB